jgi:protein TonB
MPAAPAAPPPRQPPVRDTRPPVASPRKAVIASALIHAALAGALVYVFWQPPRPARVEVFELVSLETPKLRPLAPKTPEPPPPPEEKKVETRAPEAPKLTSTPKNPVPSSKPEPKKPPPPVVDTAKSLPVKEVARENSNLSPVQVTNAPANPRLSFWARQVKVKIGQRWNPPMGIDVNGVVKTTLRFRVSMDGAISNVEITESSGNKQLDDEATRAVKRTDNLPPPRNSLSPDFSEEFLQVSYEFIYQGQ